MWDFNENEHSGIIFEKFSNIKFQYIYPVGAELFHADGRRDGCDKTNSNFFGFCERVKTIDIHK